jgi:two-component system sensor histidine kinase BaeS
MISITYRITGLVFFLIAVTVFGLTYLANLQMTGLFQKYLTDHMGSMNGGMMGLPEQAFLTSVHQSLNWVGAVILLFGLVISYALARSITVPLRKLSFAAEDITKGHFGKKVEVETLDEVGHLAIAFNRMTETLETNNRLRKRLLADIAHELRTPLAVMQGHLEGMLEGVIETDKEQVASLYDETVHLSRLIKDLRDLSLAEAGQLTLDKQPTDINLLVLRAVQMLKPLADEKEILLEHDLGLIPSLQADAGRINQVLYNLLTNSLRHTPVNGAIKVFTSTSKLKNKQMVKIEIRDSGSGISGEDLPHIFNHFYRADQSRNRKSGGSGIGLAIVKQLVEIHGGTVVVESWPDAGSRFYVYLPVIGA